MWSWVRCGQREKISKVHKKDFFFYSLHIYQSCFAVLNLNNKTNWKNLLLTLITIKVCLLQNVEWETLFKINCTYEYSAEDEVVLSAMLWVPLLQPPNQYLCRWPFFYFLSKLVNVTFSGLCYDDVRWHVRRFNLFDDEISSIWVVQSAFNVLWCILRWLARFDKVVDLAVQPKWSLEPEPERSSPANDVSWAIEANYIHTAKNFLTQVNMGLLAEATRSEF